MILEDSMDNTIYIRHAARAATLSNRYHVNANNGNIGRDHLLAQNTKTAQTDRQEYVVHSIIR